MGWRHQWSGLVAWLGLAGCFSPTQVELPALESMGAKSVVVNLRGLVFASEEASQLALSLGTLNPSRPTITAATWRRSR
jgi:hypothetical protein